MFKNPPKRNLEIDNLVPNNHFMKPNSTAVNASVESQVKNTIIAKGDKLTGNIESNGDIQIYGILIGDIYLQQGTIRIMRGGQVEGDLTAPNILIDGSVQGTCDSVNLEILEYGRLKGTVKGRNFSINKGGRFIGQSNIDDTPDEENFYENKDASIKFSSEDHQENDLELNSMIESEDDII